jgi:hypothetical protein
MDLAPPISAPGGSSLALSPSQPTLPTAPKDSPLVLQRKEECLTYCQSFYRKSWDWRSTRLHERWNRADRNYNAIYDPTRLAQKEPWQSSMFIDITFQNIEIIVSQIFKTMMAPNPPIQTQAGPAGDELQARLIQDVVDYELRKSQFAIAFYDALKEAVKYGSGFVKLYWERVEDVRLRRQPITQTPEQLIQTAPQEALLGQAPMPQPGITGFQMQPTKILLKNQLCAKYVHIRDVFPDPNTTSWDRLIHRDKITYGEILRYIKEGTFFDVRAELQDVTEGDKFEMDITNIMQERGYFEIHRDKPRNEKKHTVWELYAHVPMKWIQFDMPEGDEAEELVPAKIQVASGTALLSSEINAQFDGENPMLKFDYIRTGEPYGKGIAEVLFDDQDEINESGNLGIDNMNLILNKMIVVIETMLANPDQDIVSKPGGEIRLKAQVDDVRKAIMPLEFPDLAKSFFEHRFNLERMVQEKTGANRVTLGSSGQVKDSNQTLGGMELLKQMFNERVAAYGMVIEDNFILKVAERIYGLIYQNLTPEDLKPILGEEPVDIGPVPAPPPPPPPPGMPPLPQLPPQPMLVPRYMAFAFPPPEVVANSYRFKPMGIFSLENKVIKGAQFMDWYKTFSMVANPVEAAKTSAEILGISDQVDKLVMPMPMMPPPGQEGDEGKGLKGGPNGNQPNFLPKGGEPLDRQPVTSSS